MSAADALMQSVSFLTQPAHRLDLSGDFGGSKRNEVYITLRLFFSILVGESCIAICCA